MTERAGGRNEDRLVYVAAMLISLLATVGGAMFGRRRVEERLLRTSATVATRSTVAASTEAFSAKTAPQLRRRFVVLRRPKV